MKKDNRFPPVVQLEENFKNILKIKKITGDASERNYYRLFFRDYSLIAMVYREPDEDEISEIIRLTEIYKENGINVPDVIDNIDNRILIQEDLGDISIQKYFKNSVSPEREEVLRKVSRILLKLRDISASLTSKPLDLNRMKWEINFFLEHFIKNFYPSYNSVDILKSEIFFQLEKINKKGFFAHRDFHSRNMYYKKNRIYLIDFQDSLAAPELYDLVSFSFDSYLELKNRELILKFFTGNRAPDKEQLYLTAFQRNLKALGTFGFQTFVKGNKTFKKYINRTLKYIKNNPVLKDVPELEKVLFRSGAPDI